MKRRTYEWGNKFEEELLDLYNQRDPYKFTRTGTASPENGCT